MSMRHTLKLTTAAVAALILAGCASTNSPTVGSGNVSYGDSKAVETVSNEFGSTEDRKSVV